VPTPVPSPQPTKLPTTMDTVGIDVALKVAAQSADVVTVGECALITNLVIKELGQEKEKFQEKELRKRTGIVLVIFVLNVYSCLVFVHYSCSLFLPGRFLTPL
jgi:hypothetical protein